MPSWAYAFPETASYHGSSGVKTKSATCRFLSNQAPTRARRAFGSLDKQTEGSTSQTPPPSNTPTRHYQIKDKTDSDNDLQVGLHSRNPLRKRWEITPHEFLPDPSLQRRRWWKGESSSLGFTMNTSTHSLPLLAIPPTTSELQCPGPPLPE